MLASKEAAMRAADDRDGEAVEAAGGDEADEDVDEDDEHADDEDFV